MENQNKVRADLRQLKPFFIVAFVGIIYHLRIRPMAGDDVFFSQATSELGLWNYLIQRYETWTSRFVIEFLLVWIIKYPILWRLIDLALFISFPVLISKIFDGGKLLDWCAAAAVLLYPFHDMGTAGWITTTVNYFWPVWGMFFVGFLLKKMLVHKKINIVEGIAGVLVCVIASSHEQVAVILFVVFILYGIYLICGKSKKMPLVQDSAGSTLTDKKVIHSNNLYLAGMVLVNIITLISILFCPGNAGRNTVSIADLPIFETYGFGDKLYLGLLSIERVFIANCDAVFLTVALVLAMLVYVKTDDYKKTIISALPVLILFGQTAMRTAYPGLSGLFVMPQEITEWSWGALSTWLPMVYLAVTVATMLYALWIILGERPLEYIYALLMLGCGFGAGMILGFMATIYVSGERVYITLYFIMLFVTMFCIYRMADAVEEKIKQTGGKLAVTLLVLICLVNVGFVTLSC